MIYLGNKAVGLSHRFLLNWDKVAQGTENLSIFDDICLTDNITIVVDNAFAGLPIKNIVGNAVTSINNKGFNNCRYLSSISFKNVETIESDAFRYCASKFSASPFLKLKTIGNNAFRECAIECIVGPNVISCVCQRKSVAKGLPKSEHLPTPQ